MNRLPGSPITRTILLSILLLTGTMPVLPVFAQEARGLRGEIALNGNFFLYDTDPGSGFGTDARLLLPIGRNDNYMTAGLSFDQLRQKSKYSGKKYTYNFLNAVAGYRRTVNAFYFEPQLGAGLYRESGFGDFNFLLGLESGFCPDHFVLALRFRLNSAGGVVFGEQFSVFSLRVGYRF